MKDTPKEILLDKICERYAKGEIDFETMYRDLDLVIIHGRIPEGYADPRLIYRIEL